MAYQSSSGLYWTIMILPCAHSVLTGYSESEYSYKLTDIIVFLIIMVPSEDYRWRRQIVRRNTAVQIAAAMTVDV
eukprot:scaffold153639_cov50-Prasinocladus_malaysianus.AAC.2